MLSNISFYKVFGHSYTLISNDIPRILFSIVLVVLISFFIAHIRTTAAFRAAVNSHALDKKPPTLPGALPWLGHALRFSWDPPSFIYSVK